MAPSSASGVRSHVVSPFPYTTLVRSGCSPNRPETVALSLKTPPTRPEAGAWVVSIAGPAGVTSTGSAAQPDSAAELLWRSEEHTSELQAHRELGGGLLRVTHVPLAVT